MEPYDVAVLFMWKEKLGKAYVIGTTIVFFFLPFVLLAIVYAMFANTLQKHDQYMNLIINKEMHEQPKADKPLELLSDKSCGFKNKKYLKCATSSEHEHKNSSYYRNSVKKSTNNGDAFVAASRQTHQLIMCLEAWLWFSLSVGYLCESWHWGRSSSPT